MRARYQRELDILESGLSVLATIGSVSPYIGLFGTVWGIMDAFTGLGNLESASWLSSPRVLPKLWSPPRSVCLLPSLPLSATTVCLQPGSSLEPVRKLHAGIPEHFGSSGLRTQHGTQRQKTSLAEMNVVPYIDVMLVLVVILMVAAPYVNPSIVDLPKVNKAARTPDKVVEVIISPDGKLQIRDTAKKLTPVDFPQLVSTVESMQTDGAQVPVVIAADKTVAYEKVIDVMRNLQKANITRIGLSLQLEGSGAK